jgi:hypothetical protein
VIEVIDGVPQFMKHIFLLLTLARHIGERPDGQVPFAPPAAQGTDGKAQPAPLSALRSGHAHFFLQAFASARRFHQPINRLGGVGIADEGAFDRPHVVGVGGTDEIEIGGIGIDDAAVATGDHDAVGSAVDHRFDQRVAGFRGVEPQNAAGECEQAEHADGRKRGEEREDIGFGIAAALRYNDGRGANQERGDQEHEDDAAAPGAGAAIDRSAQIGAIRLIARRVLAFCRLGEAGRRHSRFNLGQINVGQFDLGLSKLGLCAVMPCFQCLASLNRARGFRAVRQEVCTV